MQAGAALARDGHVELARHLDLEDVADLPGDAREMRGFEGRRPWGAFNGHRGSPGCGIAQTATQDVPIPGPRVVRNQGSPSTMSAT